MTVDLGPLFISMPSAKIKETQNEGSNVTLPSSASPVQARGSNFEVSVSEMAKSLSLLP